MSAAKSFRIISADHTGITVSNLERSLAFWRDVPGFELSHTAHQTGEMAEQITGVKGAELKLAVVKAPGGHKIELLEYLAPQTANARTFDRAMSGTSTLRSLSTTWMSCSSGSWPPVGKRLAKRKRSKPVRMPASASFTFVIPTARQSSSCRCQDQLIVDS